MAVSTTCILVLALAAGLSQASRIKEAEVVKEEFLDEEEPEDEKIFALIEQNSTFGCPGTYNGAYDHCKSWCQCGHGHGDCDSDRECQPGLKCTHNVGAQFGMRANVDVCLQQGGMMGGMHGAMGGMHGGMHGGMMGGGMYGGDMNGDGVPDAVQGGGRCRNGCVYCPAGTHDQFTCQPNMNACGYNGFIGEMMESVDHCN